MTGVVVAPVVGAAHRLRRHAPGTRLRLTLNRAGLLIATLMLAACAGPSPAPTATVSDTPTAGAFASQAAPPATATPAATPAPALVPGASQTPPPVVSPMTTRGLAPRQLTTGGCCVEPFWSPDSQQVRYIDRPSTGAPSGIWGVGLSGGPPVFVTARLGIYSPDQKLVAYLESGQTYVERVGGERWKIDNGGRAVNFSPDSQQIAWQTASSSFNFDQRQVDIWVAKVGGSDARRVASLAGAALAGWFPDNLRLLVGNRAGNAGQVLLQALSLPDGRLTPIANAPGIQSAALSPLGGWLVYQVSFSGDAGLDGLWVVRVGNSAIRAGSVRRLDSFGAYAWQSEGGLLVIPLEQDAASNRLLEVAADTGQTRALTDPAATPFQIAQGNWSLSPDGAHIAFVSAADHNIWVIDLTG